MTPDQMSELNTYEGFYNAEFFDYDKDTLCVVYIGKSHIVKRAKLFGVLPTRAYLDIIMAGAIEKRLGVLYSTVEQIKKSLPPERVNFGKNPKRKLKRK